MKSLKILGTSSVLALSVLFAGCGASTPSCDTKNMQDAIMGVVLKYNEVDKLPEGVSVSFSDFTTKDVDESTKTLTCRAKGSMTDGTETDSGFFNYKVRYTDNGDVYIIS